MRAAFILLLVLTAVVVQTTWLVRIAIRGVVLDPVLPLVMAIGFLRGPEEGALFGLTGGLLQDLFAGTSLGLMGMAKLTLGFLAGFLTTSLYLESALPVLVVTVVGTLFHEVTWTSLAGLTGQFPVPFTIWAGKALLQALYNAPLGPLGLALVRRVESKTSGSRRPHPVRPGRGGGQ